MLRGVPKRPREWQDAQCPGQVAFGRDSEGRGLWPEGVAVEAGRAS